MNNNNKISNYKYEKTKKERLNRSIKRMSRLKYPLSYYDDNYGNTIYEYCFFCFRKAEVRHHTTEPIKTDEIIFMCKSVIINYIN